MNKQSRLEMEWDYPGKTGRMEK